MEVNNLVIHKVIAGRENIELVDNPKENTPFYWYIKSVIEDIANDKKGKYFKIRDKGTQVMNLVFENALQSNYTGHDSIATRLLSKETETQQNVERLDVEIKPGILVQASIFHKDRRKYIICKAEHASFINEKSYKEDTGYPEKRKIIKAFIIVFDDDDSVQDIMVNDSNSKISKYWWDDFLELDKKHDDVYNTSTAFFAVDKVLSQYKKKFPADHIQLRNSTIRAFRTIGEFDFDRFVENTFRNYEPIDNRIGINILADKIAELPQKRHFDNRFDSVTKEIKARLKSVIDLNDNIELHIKQDIDISNTITAFQENNIKYIKIRTDKGYDTFINSQFDNDAS